MGNCQMIYVTGASGIIGTRFLELCDKEITKISYRDTVEDVFESHQESCLIHFAWSSTTRNTYDDLDKVFKSDVLSSKKLFDYYADKNPNGKIIFISSAGDLHLGSNRTVSEDQEPSPHSLYGQCKLHVENMLKELRCNTIILRTSNIWGTKVDDKRVNGLVDKLLSYIDTDNVIDIYADLKTRIDLVHIDDFIDLILKVIDTDLPNQHELFLVGAQSLEICDIIYIMSKRGKINIRINQKAAKTYLHVENWKAKKTFNWEPTHRLI